MSDQDMSDQEVNEPIKSGSRSVSLSLDLINGILQYLGTQPYSQVSPIIDAIHNEAKAIVSS